MNGTKRKNIRRKRRRRWLLTKARQADRIAEAKKIRTEAKRIRNKLGGK